jgi:hypothetical protein
MAKEAAEIDAILARLREELRTVGPQTPIPGGEARADAERLWSVTAEPHLEPGRGPLGWPKRLVKLVLYRAMRWYVEPFAGMQREYNLAALKLVDELSARVAELEERLAQLERHPSPR